MDIEKLKNMDKREAMKLIGIPEEMFPKLEEIWGKKPIPEPEKVSIVEDVRPRIRKLTDFL